MYVMCALFLMDGKCQNVSVSAIISLVSQSSRQAEKHANSLQNGQKLPPTVAKASTPVKKQEPTADSKRLSRPPGERRCVIVNL